MPHRVLSVEEAARYLHVSESELMRLAKAGQIPFEMRGKRVVFRLVEIDAWASQRILAADTPALTALHQQTGTSPRTPGRGPLQLADFIQPNSIAPALAAKTKASVLREMVALADSTGLVCDAKDLLATLEAREELCPTAVPGGVAFLHPRSPQPHLFACSLLALGRTVQPIYFGAPDRQPTDLFFLLGCQDDTLHLHTLARLCLIAQKTDVLAQLRAAPADAATLHQILLDAEASVLAAMPPPASA